MKVKKHFDLIYAPQVIDHLRSIDQKYHRQIREAIEKQLAYEPDREGQNRKPLKRSITFEAEWELRMGLHNRFRIFYLIKHELNEVNILAIGEKIREQLKIGGEEVEL